MKKISLILILTFCGFTALFAEGTVLLYNGKKIIIHDDFTWEYLNTAGESTEVRSLDVNNGNKKYIGSSNGKYGVHVDFTKWQKTTGINDQAGIQLMNYDETAFAMVIFDGLEIPLESMKELMIINANNLDPNARIISSEKCLVGSVAGELITYTANSAGLNFVFYAFVTTSRKGTIQFTCFTLDNAFEDLKGDFEDLISGFQY